MCGRMAENERIDSSYVAGGPRKRAREGAQEVAGGREDGGVKSTLVVLPYKSFTLNCTTCLLLLLLLIPCLLRLPLAEPSIQRTEVYKSSLLARSLRPSPITGRRAPRALIQPQHIY